MKMVAEALVFGLAFMALILLALEALKWWLV